MALKKREKEIYKKTLLELRSKVLQKVKKFMDSREDAANKEVMDSADQAIDSYENELLYGLSDSEKKYLEEIEDALKRIEDGTYGKCISCNKDITQKRLKVMPFAHYCIKCKEKLEKSR